MIFLTLVRFVTSNKEPTGFLCLEEAKDEPSRLQMVSHLALKNRYSICVSPYFDWRRRLSTSSNWSAPKSCGTRRRGSALVYLSCVRANLLAANQFEEISRKSGTGSRNYGGVTNELFRATRHERPDTFGRSEQLVQVVKG